MAANVPLKVAFITSGQSQISVAVLTGIHEARLSKIVNGHLTANADEQLALATALGKSVDELFPAEPEASTPPADSEPSPEVPDLAGQSGVVR